MSTKIVKMGKLDAVQVDVPTLVLRVLEGPDAGRVKAFEETPVVIGSSDEADLVLADQGVSRRHVELRETAEGVLLRDLGSTNGTYLGGARIEKALLLEDTEVRIGEARLAIELGSDPRVALLGSSVGHGGHLVGESRAFQQFRAALRAAGPARAGVLLLGESGTGKERAAEELHAHSGRGGSLVVFDCSTVDRAMLRSDLFGHTKGAFTGASADRQGAVQAAHQGTLFLDEVGELPEDLQAHLLRVLESRQVQPLGSDQKRPVDVRVVAATHRDLGAMVQEGSFRRDLFHRLAVVVLRVPPLRERIDDLRHLVAAMNHQLGTEVVFSPAAWRALEAHSWPGNVRELRNVVERVSVVAAGRAAEPADLALGLDSPSGLPEPAAPATPQAAVATTGLGEAAEQGERAAIEAALAAHDGKRAATAETLGISQATLWRRMKKYGL